MYDTIYKLSKEEVIMSKEPLKLDEHKQSLLARLGVYGYTLHGYMPTVCEWSLSPDQVADIIYKISKSYLDDIDSVSLGIKKVGKNNNIPVIAGYVWLPANSHHIINDELKIANGPVRKTFYEYSDKLTEYLEKFSENKNQRPFKGEYKKGSRRSLDRSVIGIEVIADRFIQIEFDMKGVEYGKLIRQDFTKNLKVMIEPKIEYKNGEDEITHVIIRKGHVQKEIRNKRDLRPNRSHNIR